MNGVKFDGVDLFFCAPHVDIDSSDGDIEKLAAHIAGKGLKVGSLVAPVWPPAGGGSAMGNDAERGGVSHAGPKKACKIGNKLRSWGFGPRASCGSIRRPASRSG